MSISWRVYQGLRWARPGGGPYSGTVKPGAGTRLAQLLEALQGRGLVARELHLPSGRVTLGEAGSFRPVNDRPALTLNFDKYREKQKFHGLDKLHLNNSVQDGGYLNEHLASVIFNAGGVPAPRISHARVWLNGRDLGFYVLKEGFDSQFLVKL